MKINLLNYFEETLKNVPSKTAIIDNDEAVSFEMLADNSKKLATVIIEKQGGLIRKPIAVYLSKCKDSVISDIAIMYSGNAYMNLDVNSPIPRLQNVLELIQPELLITNNKYIENLTGIWPATKIINVDALNFRLLSVNKQTLNDSLNRLIDTDPLCIINTSGSTGVPKGVILNHRSFIDFTDWANEATGIGPDEIIGSLSPTVFDIYSFELCMLMVNGNTMVLIPEGLGAFPVKVLEFLQKNCVSYIFWVPTIMVNIANMDLLSKMSLDTLKIVWFAGEVFPTKQFNYWKNQLPTATFINLYGPIEITLDCTYYIVDRDLTDDEPIPIGYPCRNTDILILNENDQLVGMSEEGELCVRGTSLAMGYYNNPEKTSEVFVQNPLNSSYPELIYRTGDIVSTNLHGEILFKGRKDTLIKHSGYRIELTEIEHVIINTLNLVKNGCCVYDYKNKQIVFYYELDEELKLNEIRKSILSALPKYMVPSMFIRLDTMPKNTNGKIDRLKLKEMLTH